MTPNGWKQLSNIWFGTLWVKLLFAMHARCMHAWNIHATVDFRDLIFPYIVSVRRHHGPLLLVTSMSRVNSSRTSVFGAFWLSLEIYLKEHCFSAVLSSPMIVSKSTCVFSPQIRILFRSTFRLTRFRTENGGLLEVPQAGSPGTLSCVLD